MGLLLSGRVPVLLRGRTPYSSMLSGSFKLTGIDTVSVFKLQTLEHILLA